MILLIIIIDIIIILKVTSGRTINMWPFLPPSVAWK